MIKVVLLLSLDLLFPLVIVYMCKRWSVLKKLGSIVLAYAFGLVLGSTGLIPRGGDAYHLALQGRSAMPKPEIEAMFKAGTVTEEDILANQIASSQDILTSVIVPLAFPLLLFSLNIRRWLRFAKEGFISMVLALVSVVIVIAFGYLIFRDMVPDAWKVGGMLVGVYTGGTPNLVSLKLALGVDPNLFIMTSTYDMLVGAATLIFFITAGPRVFRAILPPFRHNGGDTDAADLVEETESFEDYSGMFTKEHCCH